MDKAKAIELLEQGIGGERLADALGVECKTSIGVVISKDPDLMAAKERGVPQLRALLKLLGSVNKLAEQTGWSKTGLNDLLRDTVRSKPRKPKKDMTNYWIQKPWRVGA